MSATKKLLGGFIGATLAVPAGLVMTGLASETCGGTDQIQREGAAPSPQR